MFSAAICLHIGLSTTVKREARTVAGGGSELLGGDVRVDVRGQDRRLEALEVVDLQAHVVEPVHLVVHQVRVEHALCLRHQIVVDKVQ